MKNLIFFIQCILFSLFFSTVVNAQKPPIKFGKVEISDLTMKSYDLDTSAPAVILCDYGYFNADQFQFTRILRIKILKKEGYDWADHIFPTDAKTSIKGRTFNLENGQIIETKLKNESIFKEKITEDFYDIRIAMPNVKVGSVIDIQFIHLGLPPEWRFQQTIPVKWSEIRIEKSTYVEFQKNFFGYEALYISEPDRWVGKDIPAIKSEPYINSITNYLTKFEIELRSITFPGYYRFFTTSWEKVTKYLLDREYFYKRLKSSGYLNDIVKSIESRNLKEEDLLKAAYEEVKKIKWNEKERLFTSTITLQNILKEKYGNSTDINFILINLLNKLDIETHPVALSTRNNGILSYLYPSIDKLNYAIAVCKIGDVEYLIDATDKYAPIGILPVRCLNGRGRIIDESNYRWIDLNSEKPDKSTSFYNLKLNEYYELTGNITYQREDYNAYFFRRKYNKYSSKEEYIKSFEDNNKGITVNELTIENLDNIYQPLKDIYEVEIDNRANVISNNIYINPLNAEQIKENPFKLENRKYPVDFAVKQEHTVIVNIEFPDNIEITEIPKPARMGLSDKSANFLYNVSVIGNKINVLFKYKIDKTLYNSSEYPELKEFFNQIVKKHAEPVILTIKE